MTNFNECGCNNQNYNECSNGGFNCLWLIILLLCCGGCGGSCNSCSTSKGCDCGCIIPVIVALCCCCK